MPIRVFVCLLFACLSAAVAAREIRHGAAAGGSCADPATAAAQVRADTSPARAADMPAREAKPRPAVSSGSGPRPTLRWHSFLPGMFR